MAEKQSSTATYVEFQIRMILPDGTPFYIGRANYYHPNPILNFTRGRFERWRFNRNAKRFNALVENFKNRKPQPTI